MLKLKDVYYDQLNDQYRLDLMGVLNGIKKKKELLHLPEDEENIYSQQVLHLISEVGELLQTDERWKLFRRKKYNRDNKLEELVDCLLILINMVIFSGYSYEELEAEYTHKQSCINNRIEKLESRDEQLDEKREELYLDNRRN